MFILGLLESAKWNSY